MKLQTHSLHFDADVKLLDIIQSKCNKLETFYDRITEGEVFLRLEKGDHSRENKVVEIKLHVPGTVLFAKSQRTSFEAAADDAVEGLRNQITKYKEKNQSHH